MAPLRDATDPLDVERELRLGERRRLDRAEAAQQWIAGLGVAWFLANVAMLLATCAGMDYEIGGFIGPIVLAIRTVAGFFAFVAFTAASVCMVVTLWNRSVLSAGWVVAGVMPWVVLVVEAAGVFTAAARW